MDEGNGVPPVPYTPEPQQNSAQAGQSQAPAMAYTASQQAQGQQMPSIVVNIPAQKSSKAPWIIVIVILGLILACGIISAVSCSSTVSSLSDMSSTDTVKTSGNTIAVIHVEGTINAYGDNYVTPETFKSELDAAEADPNVKAIVLRVDSGGGTSASSEEMATYIQECDKPVVVSVTDICASGAYMMASQSDYIYANEGSTVGSIGVIMTKYNIKGLLDELGIQVDQITSGADKADTSIYNGLTDDQRTYLQEQVDEINQSFIDSVAQGRGLDRDKVAELATGRTWTGQQAKEQRQRIPPGSVEV